VSWTGVRDQHVSFSRIAVNMRRKRLGMPPLGPREFTEIRAARSRFERYEEFKWCVAKFLYRSGAVQLANGRSLRGGMRLALAFPLAPRLVSSGVGRYLHLRDAGKDFGGQASNG